LRESGDGEPRDRDHRDGEHNADVFDVLMVCTGNICRSPMAELLFTRSLRTALGPQDAAAFRVHSAGTYGLHGYPIDAHAAQIMTEMGIDATAFRAREVTEAMVAEADLVLTATRDHRAAIATMLPRSARRTFTIREFGRLCGFVDPTILPGGDIVQRARALVRAAAASRGMTSVERHEDDIADPYGARLADFEAAAALISVALRTPVSLLAGTADYSRPDKEGET
jgi:protein-tyrosine phosphatase